MGHRFLLPFYRFFKYVRLICGVEIESFRRRASDLLGIGGDPGHYLVLSFFPRLSFDKAMATVIVDTK